MFKRQRKKERNQGCERDGWGEDGRELQRQTETELEG